jgi:ribosomal protein S18 acetylase RimI-like enzyme
LITRAVLISRAYQPKAKPAIPHNPITACGKTIHGRAQSTIGVFTKSRKQATLAAMSTLSIEARLASSNDAPALASVHEASWREAYAGIIPGRALERMIAKRSANWWRRALGRGLRVHVLVLNGTIVGYATSGRARMALAGHYGEIFEFYLRPEHQGLGLGRKFFQSLRKDLERQGFRQIVVRALSDNDRANAFYTTLGGRQIGSSVEYFEDTTRLINVFSWD